MAALDASLGAFFTHLDQSGVPYVVVLAADHGGIDVPERLNNPERLAPPARRIDPGVTLKDLSTFLRKTVGLAYDPLVSSDPRQLVLGLGPADEPRRAEITRAVVDWLNKRPEISHAYTAAEIAAAVPPKGKPVEELTQAERFNESFDAARSGDIIVAWPERATIGVPGSPWDTVAGHGSPWDYDRQVPILVWWPGVTAKDQTQSMETVDIAPTLAPLLGVTAPKDLDGCCIDLGQGCPR
jgi:arylsulfatase A-like enzyme